MFSPSQTFAAPLEGKKSPTSKEITYFSVSGSYGYSVVQNGNTAPSSWALGQFETVKKMGYLSLIGHNYLAGSVFNTLSIGQELEVTFADGKTITYIIDNVLRYQATDPYDLSKPFVTNNGEGKQISTNSMFNQTYKRGKLTLQTCISQNGYASWGLLFIQASPK